MRVLIVAKTHMGKGAACVGGLDLDNHRSVRLLLANGKHQPEGTDYDVGQIWDLMYEPRPEVTPPHVEDVLVSEAHLAGRAPNLRAFLIKWVQPWSGPPNQTFENLVRSTFEGHGYINEIVGVPTMSTGYWLPDHALTQTAVETKVYYRYPRKDGVRLLPYLGFAPPVEAIPAGTLVRLSLARWWRPEHEHDVEARCYLQISGWYL